MSEDESILLLVRTTVGGSPDHARLVEVAVGVLADVPIVTLALALAELLVGSASGTWVLGPQDEDRPWCAEATLRALGVLDGTTAVLRHMQPYDLSGARS